MVHFADTKIFRKTENMMIGECFEVKQFSNIQGTGHFVCSNYCISTLTSELPSS